VCLQGPQVAVDALRSCEILLSRPIILPYAVQHQEARTTRSDPTAKLVGQAIRQARHDASLTQAQLAQRLKTTTPYVTNVEAGRTNLTVGQLASIADALNAVLDVNLRVVGEDRLVVRRATGAATRRSPRARFTRSQL